MSVVVPAAVPGMDDCLLCHGSVIPEDTCSTCHAPEFTLRPPSHAINWIDNHQMSLGVAEGTCFQCHSDSYCYKCH